MFWEVFSYHTFSYQERGSGRAEVRMAVGGDQATRIGLSPWHLEFWALSYSRDPIRKTVLKTQRLSSREVYGGRRAKRLMDTEEQIVPGHIRVVGTRRGCSLYWRPSPTGRGGRNPPHFALLPAQPAPVARARWYLPEGNWQVRIWGRLQGGRQASATWS